MKKFSKFGWFEFIVGGLLIALGIFSFINPGKTVTWLVVLYGIIAVFTGIMDIIFYVKVDRCTGFGPTIAIASGILSVMAGIMLMVYPGAGKWVLSLLVPIWFIAHCVSRLLQLNTLRFIAGSFAYYSALLINTVGLILGVVMLFEPPILIRFISYLVGFYLILFGLDSVLSAFSNTGSER